MKSQWNSYEIIRFHMISFLFFVFSARGAHPAQRAATSAYCMHRACTSVRSPRAPKSTYHAPQACLPSRLHLVSTAHGARQQECLRTEPIHNTPRVMQLGVLGHNPPTGGGAPRRHPALASADRALPQYPKGHAAGSPWTLVNHHVLTTVRSYPPPG